MAQSRFRKTDRVQVEIPLLEGEDEITGEIVSIEENADDDTVDMLFLVKYDSEVDGKLEGLHSVSELRLIQGEEDKAPDRAEEENLTKDLKSGDLPSYSDYRTKMASRINTLFDALFCKSEDGERWEHIVTTKGQFLLHAQLRTMTLVDISQAYGELQMQIFSLMVCGESPDLLGSYRSLSREVLHACLCEGCYRDIDGNGVERFRKMMGFETEEETDE